MSGSAASVGMASKSSQQRRGSAGSGGPIGGGGGGSGISSKQHSYSRSYPRGVGLDFRKLAGLTLLNYIDHHGEFIISHCFCAFLRLFQMPFTHNHFLA
jgi:hypothetical protein